MKRARLAMPLKLSRAFTFNGATGLYTIAESGITYNMPFDKTVSLKKHFFNKGTSIDDWYKSLSLEDRKTVTVTGRPASQDDFYPDE